MSPMKLVGRSLRRRWRDALALALAVALGVALAVVVVILREDLARRVGHGPAPLVVGPPGSSLQVVLSEVLFIDTSAGRLPRELLAELSGHPSTRSAVPLARGDAFRGYPVIATEAELFDGTWPAKLVRGRAFHPHQCEVVLGAEVARELDLRPRDRIELGHGAEEAAHADAQLWTVVGVLNPGGGALDRALFIDLGAFYEVPDHRAVIAAEGEGLTGIWLVPKGGMHRALLASSLRGRSDLTVAETDVELGRISRAMGRLDRWLIAVAGLAVLVALLGVVVAQHQSARARRRQLALLRALGAGRRFVYGLVVTEAAIVCGAGAVLGCLGGYLAIWALGSRFVAQIGVAPQLVWVDDVASIALAVTMIGALAGAWAARGVYALDVPEALDEGGG